MENHGIGTRIEILKSPGGRKSPLPVYEEVHDHASLAVTLDSIADGVISTDLESRVLYMNRVAQKLTGWTLAEARGRFLCDVFRLVEAESGNALSCSFNQVMQSSDPVDLAPNTALVARNGRRYLIEDNASRVLDQNGGATTGIVLVFRDVTERRRLELEVQETKRLEMISCLAGGVAHDFNNMLAGIIGYSEILTIELKKNPRLQAYARSVLEISERASKLTSQLLAFSRQGKMASLPVNMHVRIASVVHLLQSSMDRGIRVNTRLNADTAMLTGDPAQLTAALLNLGINACDATLPGGEISFETRNVHLSGKAIVAESLDINPGDYLAISVSDTGAGMSDEVKQHLYEPFFTTKGTGRGAGLGLSAVYGTMKEHHGAISFKSSTGLGTVFTLYLPIPPVQIEIKEEEPASCINSPKNKQISAGIESLQTQAL